MLKVASSPVCLLVAYWWLIGGLLVASTREQSYDIIEHHSLFEYPKLVTHTS